MNLRDGGIDVFYIDESHDNSLYLVTALTIPFLRKSRGIWSFTWPDHMAVAREWRRRIWKKHKIPMDRELHGNKLAAGAGHYHYSLRNFTKGEAASIYRDVLASVDFVPSESVISVASTRGLQLYGNTRLEMAMYALFQRMRRQCYARNVNALVFFDQGHPEYRRLYRMAQVYLPTGSSQGMWDHGEASANLPLDMFIKDGNIKESKFCIFTQATDLIAYAAFLKVKHEKERLLPWQAEFAHNTLYDCLPASTPNTKASGKWPRDGIVRLWLYEKKSRPGS